MVQFFDLHNGLISMDTVLIYSIHLTSTLYEQLTLSRSYFVLINLILSLASADLCIMQTITQSYVTDKSLTSVVLPIHSYVHTLSSQ